MKLKIELSALWIAAGEPYDVELAGRAWARLIGLPDPGGRGANRVNAAVRQLISNRLVTAEGGRGSKRRLTLLDETGTGQRYIPPGERVGELKGAGEDYADQ